MANVNLKTDFKNGELLYDYQLNNNFKAIEEALKAANAIMWQDNADTVMVFRGTTEELMAREIIDGQILYDTNTGESYIDYEGKRISTGSGNAIHIGESEPENASTQLWIDEDEFSSVGSEVVNSLEGNEERMAPSVAAVNKGNTYSTEETFTGKHWIDGKKIYRKVVKLTIETISGETTVIHKTLAHNIPNIETVFTDFGHSYFIRHVKGSGALLTMPLNPVLSVISSTGVEHRNARWIFASNTNIEYYLGNYAVFENETVDIICTVEYTKTTDTVEESEE